MNILPDGTVLPSYVHSKNTSRGEPTGMFGNVALRIGEVVEVIYPQNDRSLSGQVVEYTVSVQQLDKHGWSTVEYANCVIMNLFGGLGDKLRYTARAQDKTVDEDTGSGDGSLVLLLCLNGSTNRAIIIGGFQNDNDEPEKQEDGHNLHFNFNGIDASVNKDGEFTFTFNGATDAAGQPLDSVQQDAIGGNISFTKDGNITISDASGAQSIQINHDDKKIMINGDSEMDVTIASGHVVVKSSGVLVGDATDAWVKGTTYRNGESSMNRQLMSALASMGSSLNIAAAAIQAAASMMGAGPAGNIPAAGPMGAAGAAVQIAAAQAQLMQQAIQQFEAKASSYLSKKNLTD